MDHAMDPTFTQDGALDAAETVPPGRGLPGIIGLAVGLPALIGTGLVAMIGSLGEPSSTTLMIVLGALSLAGLMLGAAGLARPPRGAAGLAVGVGVAGLACLAVTWLHSPIAGPPVAIRHDPRTVVTTEQRIAEARHMVELHRKAHQQTPGSAVGQSLIAGLRDGWDRELRYSSRGPDYQIVSAGLDGRFGTADDIVFDSALDLPPATAPAPAERSPSPPPGGQNVTILVAKDGTVWFEGRKWLDEPLRERLAQLVSSAGGASGGGGGGVNVTINYAAGQRDVNREMQIFRLCVAAGATPRIGKRME